MPKISSYDAITDSSNLQDNDNVLIQRTGANKRTTLSVLAEFVNSSDSNGGEATTVTEFILHDSAGAIAPTAPIVLVIAQADVTLPNITDTPAIIAISCIGGGYTVSVDTGDYIYTGNLGSLATSLTVADKAVLVLFSSDTSQNLWIPVARIADVSAI